MKLSQLCFVDDLILFCNSDFSSIYTLLQGFPMFSNACSLEVNRTKSEVYYVGMTAHEVTNLS